MTIESVSRGRGGPSTGAGRRGGPFGPVYCQSLQHNPGPASFALKKYVPSSGTCGASWATIRVDIARASGKATRGANSSRRLRRGAAHDRLCGN